jgi:hypothetical protein
MPRVWLTSERTPWHQLTNKVAIEGVLLEEVACKCVYIIPHLLRQLLDGQMLVVTMVSDRDSGHQAAWRRYGKPRSSQDNQISGI